LSGRHDVLSTDLQSALDAVADHRQVTLRPLSAVLVGYAELAEQRWAAWCRRYRLEALVPAGFAEVLAAVITFADVVLADGAAGMIWRASQRRWLTQR